MSSKKLYIIIAIILAIVVLGLVGYYFLILQGPTNPDGTPVGFKQFFPFGNNTTATTTNTQNTPVEIPTTPASNYTLKLRKISSEPVAGAGLLDTKAGTIVRHIEKATGHIYETELFSPTQNRISNTTIPLVYNAVWGNSNNSLVTQYLGDDNNTIKTNLLTIKTISTTTESSISGSLLANNVNDVSVLGSTIFYLQESTVGTAGFIVGTDGLKRKQIWSSPIRELLSQIVNATTVALTTKPYPNIGGYLYSVNTNTGVVKKLLGNVSGLSTLVVSDLSKVLYLSQTSTSDMFLYNVKAETSASITPATFPEKCVWSKKDLNIVYCAVPEETLDGYSQTSWYMGNISFTDDIWKYDLKANTSSIIENLTNDGGEAIDVIKPQLSDSEQYLVFINKRDGSLWSLDLTK